MGVKAHYLLMVGGKSFREKAAYQYLLDRRTDWLEFVKRSATVDNSYVPQACGWRKNIVPVYKSLLGSFKHIGAGESIGVLYEIKTRNPNSFPDLAILRRKRRA